MARVFACVADLMLASRVKESLVSAGHEVTLAAVLPERVDADLIVCDLDTTDPVAAAALEPPSIGFYSHTDVETRRRALEAGVDLVIPRSRMARELPDLVGGLL
ncbi:MAG: hypothetical protein JJE13_12460 [Thermoleophilia bacterium]|nr:hypothetical protein [Thermoleophilia bacterium]